MYRHEIGAEVRVTPTGKKAKTDSGGVGEVTARKSTEFGDGIRTQFRVLISDNQAQDRSAETRKGPFGGFWYKDEDVAKA